MSYIKNVEANIQKSPLGVDAWGRNKSVTDLSLFHSMFQYDVPNSLWEEALITGDAYDHDTHTHLVSTGVKAISTKSMLEMTSGTTASSGSLLVSKRNPRCQPNRGHLYSSSINIPLATNNGFAEFGWLGHDNGVYFRISGDGTNFKIEACRRTLDTVFIDFDITTLVMSLIPTFNPSKGNLFDIQMQWRGIGNIKYYINDTLIYEEENLGTLDYTSVSNPSMSAGYRCYSNDGSEYILRSGCVDITSEGGDEASRQPLSATTGESLILTDGTVETAMVAIIIPRHITYDGGTAHIARDIAIHSMTNWCRDESAVSLVVFRDVGGVALSANTDWMDIPGSVSKMQVGGTGSTLQTDFLTDKANAIGKFGPYWHDLENNLTVENHVQPFGLFHATAGDIVVLTVKSLGVNKQASCNIAFSEEI